ncbi:MAG: hypothetical protein LIO46_06065, partial [Clostridiales bacterium]|nr:hypothetical protein [Clostridiales bacterium]
MKGNWLRTTPLITWIILLALNAACAAFLVFSVVTAVRRRDLLSFVFLAFVVLLQSVVIRAAVVQRRCALVVYEDRFTVTTMDEDNTFRYDALRQVSIVQDDTFSLLKNFLDRGMELIAEPLEGDCVTIHLG